MSFHNLLSKNDRAIAAYLIANGVGTAADVFPGKTASAKVIPCTVIYSDRGNEVAPFSATYELETAVMVKTRAGVDEGAGPQDSRLASELRVAETFDLFHIAVDSSAELLAANITSAARALAIADPANNADLADYTAIGMRSKTIEAGQEEDGDAWIDTLHITVVCAPSDIL